MAPPTRRAILRPLLVAAILSVTTGIARADQNVQVGPGLVFSPSTVTVSPGEAVIWTFADPFMAHTTTSDATTGPEVWDSGFLTSGVFSHTFNTPGNHEYYCAAHSFPAGTVMNGVVIVLGGATATPTPTQPAPSATPTLTPPAPSATPTPTLPGPTATPTPTLPGPTATATVTSSVPTPTPTVTSIVPGSPTATPVATPGGGIPTATPGGSPATGIPVLDSRGRAFAILALALAGVAALYLARR